MKTKLLLIGYGTVGKALYTQILKQPDYEVWRIAVRNTIRKRDLPKELFTDKAASIISQPDIPVVLEAIDDADAALLYARQALLSGKTYITANKKMVASHIHELLSLEARYGGKLLFEASVCGAIPVLRTLREHLRGEDIRSVRGVLNGTCNYILTRMEQAHLHFTKALAEAQKFGYAEADPASDIDARDSYYKALILAYSAFGPYPKLIRVKWTGIRDITLDDVLSAQRRKEKIKLVALVEGTPGKCRIDIRPTLLAPNDPLYGIDAEKNAVIIEGTHTGTLMLSGPGAGGHPTASAMIGDLRNAIQKHHNPSREATMYIN